MIDNSGWANIGGINYFLDEYQQVSQKLLGTIAMGSDCMMYLKNEQDFIKAFNCCPPLKAIIGKRSKVFNTGKTIYINPNQDGKPARGAHWLKKLLKKPNVLQNEKQFFAQQNHYIDLFGYCPIYTISIPGFENEFSAIWNIPPWLFDLEYTGKWLKQFKQDGIYKKFIISWQGERLELDSKNLRFIFDDGIGTQSDSDLLIPDSRLIGMDMIVSNIVAAYKSRHTLMTKRGAMGILSNSAKDGAVSIPLDPIQKQELQDEWKKYGLTGQAYQIVITNASLQWQQMGFATKDLLLFEETTENIERLCDAYGWPIELIARGKDVTYDNKVQARKDLYVNTIIPESDSRMEQFSEAIGLEGIEIRKDYTGVPVLQQDMKAKAEALAAMNDYCAKLFDQNMMTRNEWLQELGREPMEDSEFDKLKNELTVLDDEDPLNNNEDDDTNDDETEDDETSSEDSSSETEE